MLFDVFDHLSRRGCLHWTRETTRSVVSQGCSNGLCKCRAPLSYSWLLVKSTEGMLSGITGEHRSREVPKPFLWEARAVGLLLFLFLV
jgi:hypothetical protein